MDNLTQIEIAKYLYDYAKLVKLMVNNPDKKIKDLFLENLKYEGRNDDANEEYYINTIRIAYIFTILKAFSIGEDYTMKQGNNFVDNNLIDIVPIRSKILGNLGSVSNKKILQLIRNAFNHTKEGKELYSISKDCQKITFNVKEPTPMEIPINILDLPIIINSIENIIQTVTKFNFSELTVRSMSEYIKKVEITRTCYLKKIDLNDIRDFFDMDNNEEPEDKKQSALQEYKSIEKNINITKRQRKLIMQHLDNAIENKIISRDEVINNIIDTMGSFLTKALPIPALKICNYQLDSSLLNYALNCNISYNELYFIMDTILSKKCSTGEIDRHFYNNFKIYFNDKEEKITYASLLYAEYVFSIFGTNNDKIKVGLKNINANNLRNSLVHSRWFPNKNKVCFFDALPKIDAETDYKWDCELNLDDLLNYCYNLSNKKSNEEKSKPFVKLRKYIK